MPTKKKQLKRKKISKPLGRPKLAPSQRSQLTELVSARVTPLAMARLRNEANLRGLEPADLVRLAVDAIGVACASVLALVLAPPTAPNTMEIQDKKGP